MSGLLLLALALFPASVGLAQDEGQTQEPRSPAATKPRPAPPDRLIRQAFQGALTPEQLKALGPRAAPEQLRDAMTPEQKSAARAGLAAAEAQATTHEELKEIARGYLILDESAPDQGVNALRIAETLQAADPEDSEGFSLAGSAAYQMGDYPAATEWAQRALKVNPDDERARAVYMLSKDRIARGAGSAPGVSGTAAGPGGFSVGEFIIPEKHDIAPQAIGFVRQAIAERRLGHMTETWNNVQAAMNADPKSKTVQKLYGMAKEDQASYADTKEFLRLSGEALDAGREQEALALAQRAYKRSGHHPTVGKIVEIARQAAEKRAQESAKKDLEAAAKKSERKGLHPLTTAAVIAGVLMLAWAATPQETKDHFKRVLWDEPRREVQLAAIAGVVGVAAWQLGPPAWSAAKAMLAASAPSAQGMQFAAAGAGGGGAAIPTLSWAEAATAAVKAGTLTLLAKAGFKKASEQYSYAKSEGGTATAEPPRGESASPNAQDSLNRKLHGLEEAQRDAVEVRKLPDGRVRYYGAEKPAQKVGQTRGARFVTEFDPKSGQVRQWMEAYDHGGKVVRVHPKTINGQVVDSPHYPPTGKELAP